MNSSDNAHDREQLALYDRVRLVDGWALATYLRFTRLMLLGVAGSAGAAIVWFWLEVPVLWPGLTFICLSGVALLVGLAVIPAETKASVKERAKGYTTSSRGFVEYAEVDPKSGRVIRLPGEPLLDDAERARRLEIIAELGRR